MKSLGAVPEWGLKLEIPWKLLGILGEYLLKGRLI
jgi:hypothetical protein